MQLSERIIVHCKQDQLPELEAHVAAWIRDGVKYVGIVGPNASAIEEAIDDLCVGNGSNAYFMMTASHADGETISDAVELAESFFQFRGVIQTIEL